MKHNYTHTEMSQNGVYAIVRDDQIYVGSTRKTFNHRFKQHLHCLERNRHRNPHLQNIYNKHGTDCFEFKIIEFCIDDPIPTEQKWINHYLSIDRSKLLNSQLVAGCNGWNSKRSEETKEKMRLLRLGQTASAKTKEKQSISAKQPHRLAQFEKLRNDEDTNKKRYAAISKSHIGKTLTDEHRANLSKAQVGIRRKMTDEQIGEAKQMLADGKTQKEVAECFQVDPGSIRKTVLGKYCINIRPELNELIWRGKTFGEKAGKSILSDVQVLEIIELLKTGLRPQKIYKKYNIGVATVDMINRGKQWLHLTTGLNYPINGKRKLNDEERKEIMEMYNNGKTKSEIAKKFNVTFQAINQFIKRNNNE